MHVILRLVRFKDPKDFSSDVEFQDFATLKNGQKVTVGRSKSCDCTVVDDFCSSRHCAVTFENGKLLLSDLGSKNGTSLNGINIARDEFINTKDVIVIGRTFIHIDEDRTPTSILSNLKAKEENEKTLIMNKDSTYLDEPVPSIDKLDDD